jgi:hypothetical protein
VERWQQQLRGLERARVRRYASAKALQAQELVQLHQAVEHLRGFSLSPSVFHFLLFVALCVFVGFVAKFCFVHGFLGIFLFIFFFFLQYVSINLRTSVGSGGLSQIKLKKI